MSHYYIQTYGCQQNWRDSEIVESLLQHWGIQKTATLSGADLIILNSCSVRQASEDKIYGLGRKIIALKKQKAVKVIVMGCLVGSASGLRQRFTTRFLERKMSWADLFLPNSAVSSLPLVLFSWQLIPSASVPDDFNALHLSDINKSRHAYVNISTGCDNFCTYCVVPYSRDSEISRSESEIMNEIKSLISQGITKITLLGQNVNSWGLTPSEKQQVRTLSKGPLPFARLLKTIHDLPEIEKISFLSSNPFDFTADLVEVLALPKIDRYLHIAVQSGDDEVLKRMNRKHTVKEFLALIEKIKATVPDIEIGTDLIVGFPGETQEAFQNTIKLCEAVKFNVAYVAMYSPRLGTAAAKLQDNVSKEEKKQRHQTLIDVLDKIDYERQKH